MKTEYLLGGTAFSIALFMDLLYLYSTTGLGQYLIAAVGAWCVMAVVLLMAVGE